MRPLSEATARIASQSFSRKYISLGRIINQWNEIVGEDLSDKAIPSKINYRKSADKKTPSATLEIATTSAHATTLHYQKGVILERINRVFGNDWIVDIKFVTSPYLEAQPAQPRKIPKPLAPQEKKYLTEVLEEIDDLEIKERLENLGKAILAKAQQ